MTSDRADLKRLEPPSVRTQDNRAVRFVVSKQALLLAKINHVIHFQPIASLVYCKSQGSISSLQVHGLNPRRFKPYGQNLHFSLTTKSRQGKALFRYGPKKGGENYTTDFVYFPRKCMHGQRVKEHFHSSEGCREGSVASKRCDDMQKIYSSNVFFYSTKVWSAAQSVGGFMKTP